MRATVGEVAPPAASADPELGPEIEAEVGASADEGADEGAASPPVETAGGRRPAARVCPEQTRDDTDAGWGELPDEHAHDRWLHEQRPPHWE